MHFSIDGIVWVINVIRQIFTIETAPPMVSKANVDPSGDSATPLTKLPVVVIVEIQSSSR